MKEKIPFPPLEMRQLVGPTELSDFDNPSGNLIFDEFLIPAEAYYSVVDFGCGCGRNARKLMQQKTQPKKYVGLDLHHGMIDWCQNNLTTYNQNFSFLHYDVFNIGLNPNSQQKFTKFPLTDADYSLVIAISVFTHIIEDLIIDFLTETLRVMSPESYLVSTWFLFDKRYFPMMQEFQNSLYINLTDPTNAVIYDYQWLFKVSQEIGLTPVSMFKPIVKGFQWTIVFRPSKLGFSPCDLPEDTAEFGIIRAIADVVNPHQIGL
jgi:SAM-dependent methyltransferase